MKLTKSHPVARALRSGMSMKAAWASYRGGRSVKRRNGGRRRARRSRNPLIATLSNPFGGIANVVRKVPVIGPRIANAVSVDNVKKGAAVGVTIGGAFLIPQILANRGLISAARLDGIQGIGITVGAGIATAAALGAAMPSQGAAALGAAIGAGVLQAILVYGKGALGLGQVPAGLIAGGGVGDFLTLAQGGGMGDFMTVKKPFAALPGGGLGSGQRFSKVF